MVLPSLLALSRAELPEANLLEPESMDAAWEVAFALRHLPEGEVAHPGRLFWKYFLGA